MFNQIFIKRRNTPIRYACCWSVLFTKNHHYVHIDNLILLLTFFFIFLQLRNRIIRKSLLLYWNKQMIAISKVIHLKNKLRVNKIKTKSNYFMDNNFLTLLVLLPGSNGDTGNMEWRKQLHIELYEVVCNTCHM